ncbi:hypothetical protein SVIOM74S_00630 [Streptomyces violarus]
MGTEIDSAATTRPVRSRTGAATQETSGLDSRLSTAVPRSRIAVRASAQGGRVGDAVRGHRGQLGAVGETRGDLRLGQGGQQHLADGRQCAGSRRPAAVETMRTACVESTLAM